LKTYHITNERIVQSNQNKQKTRKNMAYLINYGLGYSFVPRLGLGYDGFGLTGLGYTGYVYGW